jgi:predicted dehydrogenase
VGCGRWGRNILRDLVSLGAAVTVVEPSAAAREEAAAFRPVRILTRSEDLPEVDGIVVASPASTHAAVLSAVLSRGVPVFCEKPMTADAASARALADTAADRLFVMDKWRYHTGILELAAIARSGELGDLVGLRTWRLAWGQWITDVDCAWTLLPHELTIALEVLGAVPRPRAAVAHRARDGTLLGLTALLGDAVWHRTELGGSWPENVRRVELLGTDGIAVLPGSEAGHLLVARTEAPRRARLPDPPPWETRPLPAGESPLRAELRAFLEHLRGGPPPRSSAAEGAAVVEAVAEVRRLAGLDPSPSSAAS